MKTGGFLKRKTPLKARTGFKVKSYPLAVKKNSLKRSGFKKKIPDSKQAILDRIFSEVVRRSAANTNGYAPCITCGVMRHWRNLQCGHFQKRGNLATRYSMVNCGAQCNECNCINDGEQEKHALYIDKTHGLGMAEILENNARTIVHDFDYDGQTAYWGEVLRVMVDTSSTIEY